MQQQSRSSGRRASALNHIDMQQIPDQERFDYWRELFSGTFIDRARTERGKDFDGEMLSGNGPDGSMFANIRSDALLCTFGKRDCGLVLIGFVGEGAVRLSNDKDESAVAEPESGLMLFDCDRPAHSIQTKYNLSYLALPRDIVAKTMGTDPVARGEVIRLLPNEGMAPILYAHLRALAANGGKLDPTESEVALQSATAMALALLSRFNRRGIGDGETADEALFVAAMRYIKSGLGRHTLTASHVAAAVGCSRARLYRVFAKKDTTVGDCLRDTRMEYASRLLQTAPEEPIASIAFHAGYTDLSAFGKAFKRHFGESPRDWRTLSRKPQ